MSLRATFKWIAVVIVVIFIGLQFTTPRHTNPSVDAAQTLAATTAVPPEISAVFARSCKDCHSNQTN
jgi:cytochrome c5